MGQGNYQQGKNFKNSLEKSKSSGDNGFSLDELWYFIHWLMAELGAG